MLGSGADNGVGADTGRSLQDRPEVGDASAVVEARLKDHQVVAIDEVDKPMLVGDAP